MTVDETRHSNACLPSDLPFERKGCQGGRILWLHRLHRRRNANPLQVPACPWSFSRVQWAQRLRHVAHCIATGHGLPAETVFKNGVFVLLEGEGGGAAIGASPGGGWGEKRRRLC